MVVGFIINTRQMMISFLVPTPKSSTIKAYSVHRRLGLEIMYSKGCLANGWDAGRAFLHRGESNGGASLCVCTLHARGGACHDHEGHHLKYRNLRKTSRPRAKVIRKLKVQNLKTRTSGHQMRPPRGVQPWSNRLGCSRGGASPVEFPDRGNRELDKRGILMDFVGGANQLDHAGAQGGGGCLWRFPDPSMPPLASDQ